MKFINDTKLDNSFIIDIWAGIIYILSTHKLFYWNDLNQITETDGEDQIKSIFEVLIKSSHDKEKVYEQLSKVTFVKNNINLFDVVYKQSMSG